MVNEVALGMLFGLFGWQIAGLAIAIVAGFVIGKIPRVEHNVEDFVWETAVGQLDANAPRLTWADRIGQGGQATRENE